MKKCTRELDEVRTKSPTPVASTKSQVDTTPPQVSRPDRTRGAGDVLQMQQSLGNRYVQRALKGEPSGAGSKPTGSSRTGLPDALRGSLERLSGESLSDVEVHYDSPKPARLHALAYTRGTEIHMGPGQAHHLPHEAWHVVQQKQGRVQPTTRAGAHPINDDLGLEHEADTMGRRASSLQQRPSPDISGAASRTGGPARAPGQPIVQLLSESRKPFNGRQIKLNHTRWAREWKLSLHDNDGEGPELCSILFKLETSMKSGLPRLSVDTMQSRSRSGGAGTELMSSIPWAVEKIIQKNPVATRLGHLQLHSGFGNIIAYQMAVKKYAAALELRDTEDWQHRHDEASAALPDNAEVDTDEEAPQSAMKVRRPPYDMSRFPELWADTHVLINSGFFQIDGPMINLWSVTDTIAAIAANTKLLFDGFHASVDVKDLGALGDQIEALKEQAKQALEASLTKDEDVEY